MCCVARLGMERPVPRDWMGSLLSPMGCGLEEVNGALQAAPSLKKPF